MGGSEKYHTVPRGRLNLAKHDAWKEEAACDRMDVGVFYPENADPRSHESRLAKQVCQGCPVRIDCLVYAFRANEQWGVWGGLTASERRHLKRSMGWVGSVRHPSRERLSNFIDSLEKKRPPYDVVIRPPDTR